MTRSTYIMGKGHGPEAGKSERIFLKINSQTGRAPKFCVETLSVSLLDLMMTCEHGRPKAVQQRLKQLNEL